MSVTYDGDPSASDTAAIRFEISDTDVSAPLLQDQEIAWAILSETGVAAGSPATIEGANLFRSAARCMETLARQFAAQADTQIGELKTTYSKQAAGYADAAAELRAKAAAMSAPYSGGMSISEKHGFEQDGDATQPLFTRREFDSPWAGGRVRDDLGLPPIP